MSRLLGAAYGVFCMVLLAPPLALMRARRDVGSGWVSLGRKCTDMLLVGPTKLFGNYAVSLGWNVQRQRMQNPTATGFGNFLHFVTCHYESPLQMMAKSATVCKESLMRKCFWRFRWMHIFSIG